MCYFYGGNSMKFEKTIGDNNGALYVPIPKDLAIHLGLEAGTPVEIQDEEGKKGKYASFWKKKGR